MTKHNHKILFMVAYVAMPVFLAWIGYEFSGFEVAKKTPAIGDESVYKSAASAALKYYDLPRVSLSMNTSAGSTGTVKLDLSLEVFPADLHRVADFEPRIIEKIVMFLRRQSYEEFQKPGGARELRKGLEHEIRNGAFPIRIAAIDVREMVFE